MHNSTLCYITRGDEVLMLHRVKKKNDINHDKWIGIGGKFEADESPYECVIREMLEETGLTPLRLEYRGVVTFVCSSAPSEMMHLFICKETSGIMKTNCDEGDLQWISKSDLFRLTLWEGDKIFLKLLDERCPFFSLKLVYDNDQLIYHKLHFADGSNGL